MQSPHDVTRAFEAALCEYTGAPYCVAVNSCTMALLLAARWWRTQYNRGVVPTLEVPKRTYVGVPMSIINAGCRVQFVGRNWCGAYQLDPSPIWDSARWLTSDIYNHLDQHTRCTAHHAVVCLSFHATKTLGIEQGGAVLVAKPEIAEWFRRMRFDGRTAGLAVKDDPIREVGFHCYMNPSTAVQGLMRMPALALRNDPLPNDDYPDLSQMEAFK